MLFGEASGRAATGSKIHHQRERYKRLAADSKVKFPTRGVDAAVIVRDMWSETSRQIDCWWAQEYFKEDNSDRDQFSFTIALSNILKNNLHEHPGGFLFLHSSDHACKKSQICHWYTSSRVVFGRPSDSRTVGKVPRWA